MLPGDGSLTISMDPDPSTGSVEVSPIAAGELFLPGSKPSSSASLVAALERVIGRPLVTFSPSEVAEGLQAGVPVAMETMIDLMVTSSNDKVKLLAADKWLNKAGHGGVQRVAVTKFSFSMEDVQALAAVLEEDDGGAAPPEGGHAGS